LWCVVVVNRLNKMQLSPFLVAFLATSATVGLSNSATAQTLDGKPSKSGLTPLETGLPPGNVPGTFSGNAPIAPPPTSESAQVTMAKAKNAVDRAVADTQVREEAKEAGQASPRSRAVITPAVRDSAASISTADVLALPPTLAQFTPVTPDESPDRIRVSPGSGTPPKKPTIETPAPAPTPTAPTNPGQVAPFPPQDTAPQTPTAPGVTPPGATPPGAAPPAATPPGETPPQSAEPEPRVLVGEVVVRGAEGTFQDEVYRVLRTQPGRTTTRSQLQEDINAVFATGFFSNVKAIPEDTPLGVRVTFEVVLNPVLQAVRVEGGRIIPEKIVTDTFSPQYGQVLNLNTLQEGIKAINKWYQDNGYVLAQVLDSPAVSPEGTVTLQVAEGEVETIRVRFINKEGDDKDAKGNPVRGRTRPFIVTREFETKPGGIFNRTVVERDLQRVFGLGIFDDVRLSLQPSETDPRKVVVVANVVEKNSGSVFASAGISSASGLFGSVGYQQQNFGGNNQKLSAEFQLGQREQLFDFSFTDPWIGGDPYRTSYSLNIFRRRTISLIFDGGDPDIDLPNGDTPRIRRTGGVLSFTRPLSKDVFRRADWVASLGLQYQRISIRDRDNELSPLDQLGNDLSFSGTGRDDLFTIQFGIVNDRRNDALRPTQGSLLRLGTEQSIPVGLGSIFFNRLRASYSFYIPTQLLKLSPGCKKANAKPADCPQAFAFNIQGGTVFGDLPPYEAFSLGGSNSVRGYDEGDLAATRSFVQGTIEYRFPIFSIISGALFVDGAYNFGSQGLVPGNPGGVRGKPGSGIGYGIGVRIQSPLGPIRIDYGLNDQGDSRVHFGIGERF
jgi:outer membrane protein insertion porin family